MESKKIGIWSILCFMGMSLSLMGQTNFRGKVLDAETKTPIIGAKIGVSGQGIGVLTNDIGYFVYTKYHQVLDGSNVLEISAPGYATIQKGASEIRQLFGTVSTIYLDKASKKTKGKELNKITLYWDVSASSGTRDFETEWEAVQKFISNKAIEKVRLIAFNTAIISNEVFDVKANTVNALREKLKSLTYTGLSNYDLITERSDDAIILVSNGIPIYGEAQFNRDKPVFTVVTARTNDTVYLNKVSQYTSGSFLTILTNDKSRVSANTARIKGMIKTISGPIQGASITMKGSLEEYFSRADGSFEVPASEGDILTFSYLGMYSKGIVVESDSTPLIIDLEPRAEILDEVLLNGRDANKDEKIVTAFGKESRDKLGYATNYLSAESIKPSAQYVSDILRGQFAGVIINGFGPNATLQIRGGGQTFGGTGSNGAPLWVIDNNLLTDVSLFDINTFVDPQNIASITILKSLAATVRYGTIGIDGAIIIKTKTGTQLETDLVTSTKSALITGNNYQENLQLLNENSHQVPPYIAEINKISSIKDRYMRYQEMAAASEPSVAFYVDMALYFQKYDTDITEEILNKLAVLGGANVKVLRVLAYLYEAGGQNNKARLVYERILKLAPGESQSYRDLAMIYQEVGAYNKSLELYINMLSSQIMGVNFTGMGRVLKSELNRLVSRHKSKIDFSRLPNEFLRVGYDIDLRMVIEWSDRNVPFEFQFVNPRKKYYNWIHTLDQNKDRLYEEQGQGFQIEEFIVDDAPSGDWIVNIQYLGGADEFTIPPYLKYTVYHNYGTSRETKEIKVVKLYLQEEKVTLSKISS